MTRFVDRVVETLAVRVRPDPTGARSLAHVCVVVPTAQAGRRIRQKLAERFGALVPPVIRTTQSMRLAEETPDLATRPDELIAFRSVVGDLQKAKQLSDIRAILSAKALSFADVAENLRVDMPDEAVRWRDLAEIETKYLAALATRGKVDRIEAMKAADVEGDLRRAGVEEILRFDDMAALAEELGFASAAPALSRDQVFPCATPADEAARIAGYFAGVKANEALPALCVADPALFPEIESAFKAKGLTVHNPAQTRLVTSSLGHLVEQIVSLLVTPSYSVFSAFIRGGDVRRWLQAELKLTDEAMSAALVDLDYRQAELLPEKIDDIAPKTNGTLRAIFEFVKVQLRKKGLRAILVSIFKDLLLDDADPAAREFAAAAEVVSDLIDACGDDRELLALCLDEATYSLEPDEGDVILTDGWMELPFVSSEELVIAGFGEGIVPESVVGHPFLPDSLRRRLGLPDNAFKEARDRAILRFAAMPRTKDAVKVFFHAIDAKGDAVKPSRLLFETPDDTDLVARVKTFYGVKAGTSLTAAYDLPKDWKLKLPIPPDFAPLTKISPTRLDTYIRCPFTFYLRDKAVLGDKRMDDRAEELQSWEFGNLAHAALEAFGLSELKDSTEPAAIRDFLEEHVDGQLVERFGTAIPAIVSLQGESVKRRLRNFAELQAARCAEGWRIVSVERKMGLEYSFERPDGTTGRVRIHGKCDRIDFNETTGAWCVIDYKTWDTADPKKTASFIPQKDGLKKWLSVQLALYCAMLDAAPEDDVAAAKREKISACYCILGKAKEEVVFTAPMSAEHVPEMEAFLRATVPKIECGIFWPPAPADEWKYDYADWLSPSPEETVDEAWIDDQTSRMSRISRWVLK